MKRVCIACLLFIMGCAEVDDWQYMGTVKSARFIARSFNVHDIVEVETDRNVIHVSSTRCPTVLPVGSDCFYSRSRNAVIVRDPK